MMFKIILNQIWVMAEEDLGSQNTRAWTRDFLSLKRCILKNVDPHVLGFPLSISPIPEHEKGEELHHSVFMLIVQ